MIKKIDKILITGSKGFIGTNLKKDLNNKYNLICTTRNELNCSKYNEVKKFINDLNPDFIIHLASTTNNQMKITKKNIYDQYQDTYLSSINIAKTVDSNCKLVIFFGSIEEYGLNKLPLTERLTPNPITEYGKAKFKAHMEIKKILENKNVNYTWLRPSLMYGPFDYSNRYLNRIIESIKQKKTLSLRPGNQIRDFLFVKDLIKVLECMLNNPFLKYETLNISPASKIYLKEIPSLVYKLVNYQNSINILPKIEKEYDLYMSNQKLFKFFPNLKFTSFEVGLKETLLFHDLI